MEGRILFFVFGNKHFITPSIALFSIINLPKSIVVRSELETDFLEGSDASSYSFPEHGTRRDRYGNRGEY